LIRRFVSRPKKAGVTPAFFVRMPARLRLVCLAARNLSTPKNFSRCTQLFVMIRYYKFQPGWLDIKTCVLLR